MKCECGHEREAHKDSGWVLLCYDADGKGGLCPCPGFAPTAEAVNETPLLRCPQCGGVAEVVDAIESGQDVPYVECKSCHLSTECYHYRTDAIDAWNAMLRPSGKPPVPPPADVSDAMPLDEAKRILKRNRDECLKMANADDGGQGPWRVEADAISTVLAAVESRDHSQAIEAFIRELEVRHKGPFTPAGIAYMRDLAAKLKSGEIKPL